MGETSSTALLVGLAVTLSHAIVWLAKAIYNRNGKNGNGKPASAGQLSPSEWEAKLIHLHEESEERLMRDIRALMDARTVILVDRVTTPIVQELRGLREDIIQVRFALLGAPLKK